MFIMSPSAQALKEMLHVLECIFTSYMMSLTELYSSITFLNVVTFHTKQCKCVEIIDKIASLLKLKIH